MASTFTHLLRIRNVQIVRVCAKNELFKIGKALDSVESIENGTVIVGNDGLIAAVGDTASLESISKEWTFEKDIDGKGMSVIPGLCDAHTHPVWSGDRVHEFAMKLAGATYLEIHQAGGGIGFTVRHTRASSEEELGQLLHKRLDRMLKFGTTLVEGKSGYGLDLENEMKMLKVLHKSKHAIEIVSNYCGGHSVPSGMTAAQATDDIVNNQIPALQKLNAAGETNAELIDVFFEKGVFEAEDSKRIMKAGIEAGLLANFHGDELNPNNAGEIAAELGCLAVSHLEHLSDAGIAAMAKAPRPIFGVLLPTTAYVLRLVPPPARKMIEGDVPVALGSDYNPNAHCLSMPHVMNLACVMMKMTMNESLCAATINAAGSMNRSKTHGSIEVGKVGDLVLIDAPRWEHIIYQMDDPPIHSTIKRGKVVYTVE